MNASAASEILAASATCIDCADARSLKREQMEALAESARKAKTQAQRAEIARVADIYLKAPPTRCAFHSAMDPQSTMHAMPESKALMLEAAEMVASGTPDLSAIRLAGVKASDSFYLLGVMRLLALEPGRCVSEWIGMNMPGNLTGWVKAHTAAEVAALMRRAAEICTDSEAIVAARAEVFLAARARAELEAGPDVA